MLRMLRAMLFYFDRWREDSRERKEAMGEFMRNGWRCAEVERMQINKETRSYRRINHAYHR